MKKLTAETYTKDQLYPAVARAIAEILRRSDYVAPVDVLLQTQRITKQQYEDWRFGRIPHLERVTIGGLGEMARILRIIDLHCRKLNLKSSSTAYHKWGKRGKGIVLRFSKGGDPNVEAAYARHFVRQNSAPPTPPRNRKRTRQAESAPPENRGLTGPARRQEPNDTHLKRRGASRPVLQTQTTLNRRFPPDSWRCSATKASDSPSRDGTPRRGVRLFG